MATANLISLCKAEKATGTKAAELAELEAAAYLRMARAVENAAFCIMVGAAVMTVALLFIVVAPIAMLLLQDPCVGRLFASRKVAHHCKGSWQVRAVSGQCLHTVRERHLPQHAQYRLIMSHSYALIS